MCRECTIKEASRAEVHPQSLQPEQQVHEEMPRATPDGSDFVDLALQPQNNDPEVPPPDYEEAPPPDYIEAMRNMGVNVLVKEL